MQMKQEIAKTQNKNSKLASKKIILLVAFIKTRDCQMTYTEVSSYKLPCKAFCSFIFAHYSYNYNTRLESKKERYRNLKITLISNGPIGIAYSLL